MIPLRNLLRNKTRSLLTIAGASIGIAVFVSLSLVSVGFKTQLKNLMDSYHIDITIQSNGAATPLSSSISLQDCSKIRQVQGVGDISSLVIGPVKTPWNPYMLILGISSAEMFANRIGIIEGRLPLKGHAEVMIGELLANRADYHVGNKILLSDKEMYKITGIFTSESNLVAGAIILDEDDARRLLRRYDSVNMIFVQVNKGENPRAVSDLINKVFPAVSAMPGGDFIGQVRMIKVIDALSWVVSAIALFAACIVVMNTLVMSASERTKEVGILMAIGWSSAMIMKMIIIEALVICIVGGFAGNILGLLQFYLFNWLNPEGIGTWMSSGWSIDILIRSLLISAVMGLISSVYPAVISIRLNPAEALRHE